MVKDYYSILGVGRSADEDEIKKAYRRLALKYHPDRNPGDRSAEERFKEIAEAYAVLMDRQKREQFNRYAHGQAYRSYTHSGAGFQYNREDIFREMFRNPNSRNFFSELQREFQKQGFRFDENFFNDIFFKKQTVFFGGVFYSGQSRSRVYTFGDRTRNRTVNYGRRSDDVVTRVSLTGFLSTLLQGIGRFFSSLLADAPGAVKKGRDMTYRLNLSISDAKLGKEIIFRYRRGDKTEKISVRIPPGVKDGTRLRLSEMGMEEEPGGIRGDVYLVVNII
ncbi:MAG: DnaJ domain-containing protein [Syntrophales bacterium]